MRARARIALALALLVPACPEERGAPRYNLPQIGAPALKPPEPAPALDAGPARVIEEQLPEEAARHFRTLDKMARSPRWAPFARIIRQQVADLYARVAAGRPKPPHDIAVTQFFIRQMPEIYGVDFVAWCGAEYVGKLSYVENHLLVAKIKGQLEMLAVHRPTCGSVGDRSVSFSDLVGDGQNELIESYVEDQAVGDDFIEVRVFRLSLGRLRRIAEIRVSSPVKFFNVEYRKRETARDIVLTHIEMEKALGRLRARPCWVYRYFEVETTYRHDKATDQFKPAGTARKRLAPNVALDLTGGVVPEGSCEG
jgi:hypothetical protein